MSDPIAPPPPFTAALVFDDPTPNAIILNRIIDSRDRVNHCQEGGLKIEKFAVFRNPDGTIHVPMWSDEQELAKAMDAIWSNFFHFVEDFIMLALHVRVLDDKFSMFRREEPLTSTKSSWAVTTKADGDALIKKLGATPV